MNEPALIFGAALDYLDDAERIGLKLAYLEAVAAGRLDEELPADPYEAIAPIVVARGNGVARLGGKIEVPGWLQPRPPLAARSQIDPHHYRCFMTSGGITEFVEKCRQRAQEIFPAIPVMIAVDHALAGGTIRAVSEHYGAEKVAVVILDGHFDAISSALRAASLLQKEKGAAEQEEIFGSDMEDFSFETAPEESVAVWRPGSEEERVPAVSDEQFDFGTEEEDGCGARYGECSFSLPQLAPVWGNGLCGDFLEELLKTEMIRPENLYVIGVNDYLEESQRGLPLGEAYWSWLRRGVKVYPKREVMRLDFCRRLARELAASESRILYVSLDADVGAAVSMNAVRFACRPGLPAERILAVGRTLRELLEWERFHLGGMDLCEIDVHLLGLEGPGGADRTVQLCSAFAATLLGNMTLRDLS